MKNNKPLSLLVVPSYMIGVALGLYLIVIAAWADMESAFYGFSRLADSGLRGFSCPVLMTRGETNVISLRVSNGNDTPINPVVKMEISTPLMLEESQENFRLEPGGTKRLEWSVGSENIDLDQFIFAKALVFSTYPAPNLEATCGIFILDLPGRGSVILTGLVALCLLGLGGSVYAMRRSSRSDSWVDKHVRPMAFLAILIVLGIIVSFLGGWVPSILILAMSLLMIVILGGSFIMSERRRR